MQSNVLSCTHRRSNELFQLSNRSNSLILNSAICHPPKRSPPREPLLPRPTFRASDFSGRNKAVHRQNAIDQSISDLLDASDCSMARTNPENSEGILFASKNNILLKFFSVLIPFHFSLHGVVLLRLAKIKVRSRKLILPLANPAWTCTELLFLRKKIMNSFSSKGRSQKAWSCLVWSGPTRRSNSKSALDQ